MPYVNGVDLVGPVLEETVGEAARGGPDVERSAAREVEVEVLRSPQELVASQPDEAHGGLWRYAQRVAGGDILRGLGAWLPVQGDLPLADGALRLRTAGEKAMGHEEVV